MRVLAACSLGGSGHLNPLVPFLAAARAGGHETLVTGPPALRDLVAATGFPFTPGGEPPESVIAPIRERLPVAPPLEASILGNRELFGRLATEAMLPSMRALVADWRPDLVLREPCEYASAVVALEHDIARAQVAISVAEAEDGAIAVAAPALEPHGAAVVDDLRAMPYLTRFPRALDPSPFPATVRYRESQPAPPAGGLPAWWSGSDAPLVYVTFGTVLAHMTIAADIFRTALAAVAALDARVLFTVGRRFDPAGLGAVPDHVHVEQWVDQADVLGAADLVVCHGGSGTVFGALAAGVPIIAVPLFADQFENGRRVAAAGAGTVVTSLHDGDGDGARRLIALDDAPRIRAAIDDVLAAPSYLESARAIAAEMTATPDAATVLHRLLGAIS